MCRREPRLDELLADPLIRLVMASDAVEEADIRRLAHAAAHRAPPAGAPRAAAGAACAGRA